MREPQFLISNLQFPIFPSAMTLPEPPQERRTAVQFSLRQLLLVMSVVALVSPLLLLVMPYWTPEQWRAFGQFAAALCVPMTLAAFYGCLRRRRVERQAGLELVSFPRRRWRTYRHEIMLLPFLLLLLSEYLRQMMNGIPFTGFVKWPFLFAASLGGAYLGWILIELWWNVGRFELCERGIILDALAFRPWSAVRTLRWNGFHEHTLMLDCGGRVREVPVPPEAGRCVFEGPLRRGPSGK